MNRINKRLKSKAQPDLVYFDFIGKVNQLDFDKYPDEELKETISGFYGKNSYSGTELTAIYGLMKEVIHRLTGLKLFDSQLAASASLMYGKVAELPTGEGKTLAAVIPAAIHAMQGFHVHVLTFNDYLAERDYYITRSVYEFCGITSGFVTQETPKPERRKMYQCDIVYVTVKEAGFDYLKNFLCMDKHEFIPILLQYAIIDEADSIMIDEAKNPLVIACDFPRNYEQIKKIYSVIDRLEPDTDFIINKTENQAYLTEQGVRQAEQALSIRNLFEAKNIDILSMVNMALQAKFLLKSGVDYIISENKVRIIDDATGRTAANKKYPDLLHASVEAKEGLPLSGSSMIYNTITIQNFLLLYKKLSGMTGTAKTSENELYQVYGLEVDVISPHTPSRRIDRESILFPTKGEKYEAVIAAIVSANQKGQPVLIGTQSVEESELVSDMLSDHSISHCVLNARNDKEEAALIKDAGKPFAVTVSTNMAGRGVDIKLGGANEAAKREVREAGGLFVIGTGFNRSIRIDNQLRGRAGRQGDIGKSRFFVSLEDGLLEEANGFSVETVKAAARVQRHIEGTDENFRLILSKYAYILEQQRKIITDYRDRILFGHEPFNLLLKKEAGLYRSLVKKAGINGVSLAEKQLLLYYINLHWAQYLESMEYVRDGIHLTVIGGLNPIDEYNKIAVAAYDEIRKDIETDVIHGLKTYKITENGIDMDAAGLGNATTTWTYLIDDNISQFSALPRLIKNINNQMKGTLFSISAAVKYLREKILSCL